MTMSNLSTTCKQKIKEKIAKKIGREAKEKYASQKRETCNEKTNNKNPKT